MSISMGFKFNRRQIQPIQVTTTPPTDSFRHFSWSSHSSFSSKQILQRSSITHHFHYYNSRYSSPRTTSRHLAHHRCQPQMPTTQSSTENCTIALQNQDTHHQSHPKKINKKYWLLGLNWLNFNFSLFFILDFECITGFKYLIRLKLSALLRSQNLKKYRIWIHKTDPTVQDHRAPKKKKKS